LTDGSLRTMADARQQFPDFEITRSWKLPDAPRPEPEESLETYLRRLGFTEDQLHYTRRAFGNAACESIARLSARSCMDEWTDTEAGEGDFRILEGYIRIHEHLAADLDIRLNTTITRIEWGIEGVKIEADDGAVYTGESAIITLPVGVLKSGRVAFVPALPPEKQAALAGLSMGPAMKLIYWFDQPVLPEGIGALYSALCPAMWWSPSAGRAVNGQAVTALATGDYSRALHTLGETGALASALQTLRAELNRPDLEPAAARWVNWTADEFALGGYSVAAPGAHEARLALAQATPPLFWAGEATVRNGWAATVHGALVSGQRAAAEAQHFVPRTRLEHIRK
jgi:monoamine oxidase